MKLDKALKNIIIPEDLTPKVESYVMNYINRPISGRTIRQISIALLMGLLLAWIITVDHDRTPVKMAEENELKIISIMVVETHTAIWLEPLSGQNGG